MRRAGAFPAIALAAAVAVALAAPLLRARAAEAQKPGSAPPASAPAAPSPPQPPPPYEPQLMRLAELLGALTYLRDLCGEKDSADLRAKMAALLDAEAGEAQRRDRLAGAYNKSFRDYALSYRICGPAARAVIAHDLAETVRLTDDLASRYGG